MFSNVQITMFFVKFCVCHLVLSVLCQLSFCCFVNCRSVALSIVFLLLCQLYFCCFVNCRSVALSIVFLLLCQMSFCCFVNFLSVALSIVFLLLCQMSFRRFVVWLSVVLSFVCLFGLLNCFSVVLSIVVILLCQWSLCCFVNSISVAWSFVCLFGLAIVFLLICQLSFCCLVNCRSVALSMVFLLLGHLSVCLFCQWSFCWFCKKIICFSLCWYAFYLSVVLSSSRFSVAVCCCRGSIWVLVGRCKISANKKQCYFFTQNHFHSLFRTHFVVKPLLISVLESTWSIWSCWIYCRSILYPGNEATLILSASNAAKEHEYNAILQYQCFVSNI